MHLARLLAQVTGRPPQEITSYINELRDDASLRDAIIYQVTRLGRYGGYDPVARYGRRMGWYALVRAMKPKVVIETGVEKGAAITPDLRWAMREAVNVLVQLFAPMMPHLAEECWAALGHKGLVAEAAWPKAERDLLIEDTVTLPVQVNGRKRADVTVARDTSVPDIQSAVLALDAVKRALGGKSPKKVIVVPQRIVNVVA